MRVLIIAYACEPNRTSEPGVGWNIVGQIATFAKVTVVTRCHNRDTIEAYIQGDPGSVHAKVQWLYYELPDWMYWLKKRIPEGVQFYQEFWQCAVSKRRYWMDEEFDIVHHLTFGSIFFTPWGANKHRNFVWGPVGGGIGQISSNFLQAEPWSERLHEYLYWLICRYTANPPSVIRRRRDAVRALLFRTSELAATIETQGNQITAIIPETAYEKKIVKRDYNREEHPLEILCVGRLIALKGVKYSLLGFARFLQEGGTGHLSFLGHGPQLTDLEQMVRRLQLERYVTFCGHVPNDVVLKYLQKADLLLHLSFREGGSWSILEGMAQGVPVICQSRAGMKDMVTEGCGTLISAVTPINLIEKSAHAMLDFYLNPQRIADKGRMAQERVCHWYSWEHIGLMIKETYSQIMK